MATRVGGLVLVAAAGLAAVSAVVVGGGYGMGGPMDPPGIALTIVLGFLALGPLLIGLGGSPRLDGATRRSLLAFAIGTLGLAGSNVRAWAISSDPDSDWTWAILLLGGFVLSVVGMLASGASMLPRAGASRAVGAMLLAGVLVELASQPPNWDPGRILGFVLMLIGFAGVGLLAITTWSGSKDHPLLKSEADASSRVAFDQTLTSGGGNAGR